MALLAFALAEFACAPTRGRGPGPPANENANESIDPPRRTLTIEVVGPGSTIPAPGQHEFDEGSTQSVRAVPDANAYFVGWSGDIGGAMLGHATFMDAGKRVVATFRLLGEDEVAILVDVQPFGAGRVELSPPGQPRGVYARGTQVTITAIPNAGFQFVRLTEGTGDGAVQTLTLDRIVTATAVFSGGCGADTDCNDGLLCSGTERCVAGRVCGWHTAVFCGRGMPRIGSDAVCHLGRPSG